MGLFKPNVQKMQEKRDVRGLIKALSDNDPQVRSAACNALGNIGDTRAVEPIIILLKDQSELVRGEAADALGSLGDRRAAGALLEVLPERSTFSRVANALAKLKDPRLFDQLIPVLDDDTLCSQAAFALGFLGILSAVEPLMKLLDRQDVETRRSAVLALGILGDPDAEQAVRRALSDEDGTVRKLAIDSLEKMDCPLEKDMVIRLLHDPDIQVREAAACRIDLPEESEVQAWYAAARREWDLAASLGWIAAEPLHLAATQHKDIYIRIGAATALAKTGDRRAVELLISGLDSNPGRAAEALGKYGDRHAVKPLQELTNSRYPGVQRVAFDALSELEKRLNRIATQSPGCTCCSESIPAVRSTIADDIRKGGGTVIGTGLDQILYEGVICRTCGRIFCLKCHNPSQKGQNCPVCKNELSPLFADYLLG